MRLTPLAPVGDPRPAISESESNQWSERLMGRRPIDTVERAAVELLAWIAKTHRQGNELNEQCIRRWLLAHHPYLQETRVMLLAMTLLAGLPKRDRLH